MEPSGIALGFPMRGVHYVTVHHEICNAICWHGRNATTTILTLFPSRLLPMHEPLGRVRGFEIGGSNAIENRIEPNIVIVDHHPPPSIPGEFDSGPKLPVTRQQRRFPRKPTNFPVFLRGTAAIRYFMGLSFESIRANEYFLRADTFLCVF